MGLIEWIRVGVGRTARGGDVNPICHVLTVLIRGLGSEEPLDPPHSFCLL